MSGFTAHREMLLARAFNSLYAIRTAASIALAKDRGFPHFAHPLSGASDEMIGGLNKHCKERKDQAPLVSQLEPVASVENGQEAINLNKNS